MALPSKTLTLSPVVPVPISVRPFKPSQSFAGRDPIVKDDLAEDSLVTEDSLEETDKESPDATISSSTSVVSSSFRMRITAETTFRRNLLIRAVQKNNRQLQDAAAPPSYPSIDKKEQPAIIEHLMRVFDEVLSIAPTSISVVFEGDLDVENITNLGVIRESVFRVVAIFEGDLQSDSAVSVLDTATIYAFVGPEEEEFIKILKNAGDPIVDGPAEYDVNVMKVNYSANNN